MTITAEQLEELTNHVPALAAWYTTTPTDDDDVRYGGAKLREYIDQLAFPLSASSMLRSRRWTPSHHDSLRL